MAAKKARKPREMNPPNGPYNIQDSTGNGFHANSLAKKSKGNPYVAQGKPGSGTNVPRMLSWPKGGGVSSRPKTRTQQETNAYGNARRKDIDRRYMLEPRFGSKKVGDAKDRIGRSKSRNKNK